MLSRFARGRQRPVSDENPALENLEFMKAEWPHFVKDTVCTIRKTTGEKFVYFASEVRGLRFYICAVIGLRGGLSELSCVWDPNKAREVDQVLLADRAEDEGHFVSIGLIRQAMKMTKGAKDKVHLCQNMVQSAAKKILADPGMLLRAEPKSRGFHMSVCGFRH